MVGWHRLAACLIYLSPRIAPSLSLCSTLDPFAVRHPCCCRACPKAHLAIISNPVNSTVPIAAEILKRHGVYDPKRLFGVTTLDVLRANTFIAESQKWAASATDVTVVGGHAGITILPLLSQIPGAAFTKEAIEALTHRIQFGGDEVVKAKDGAGSATLSMAAAADRFVASLLRAMGGAKGVTECAYVESPIVKGVPFFSTRVELTVRGAFTVSPLLPLLPLLRACVCACVCMLCARQRSSCCITHMLLSA